LSEAPNGAGYNLTGVDRKFAFDLKSSRLIIEDNISNWQQQQMGLFPNFKIKFRFYIVKTLVIVKIN